MTDAPRLLRGTLPCLAALTLATTFVLPANAQSPHPGRSAEWWLSDLNVSRAWRAAPGEGKGVVVAVLSTGVDATHPDLAGDVTTGRDYCDCGRTAAGPFWGHEGTAVASLLAGHGHRQGAGHAGAGTDGITGVAPGARILAVQVTLEYNDPLNLGSAIARSLPSAIAAGIRYAVARGAGVIALPLDPATLGPAAPPNAAAAAGSPAERAAVSYALAHNVVMIAPAGDNGAGTGSVNYPAAYPGVVAVGAAGPGGQLTPFTSRRDYVALTAPGSGLIVADPDGGYSTLASTDMSAALAAGVAALIRSQFPRLNATEVARALEDGTRPAGAHPAPGSGRGGLDAAGALTVAARLAAAVVRPAPVRTAPPPTPAPSPHARAPPRGDPPARRSRHARRVAGSVGGGRGPRADRGPGVRARAHRRAAPPRADRAAGAGRAALGTRRQSRAAPPRRRAAAVTRPARRHNLGAATCAGLPRRWRRPADNPGHGRWHARHGRPCAAQAQADRKAAVGTRRPSGAGTTRRLRIPRTAPRPGPRAPSAPAAPVAAAGVARASRRRPTAGRSARGAGTVGGVARGFRRVPGTSGSTRVAGEQRPDVRVEPQPDRRAAARHHRRRRR